MAKIDHQRVGEILEIVQTAIGPYVLNQYQMKYGGKYLQEMELTLNKRSNRSEHLKDRATALEKIDLSGWFGLIEQNWGAAFNKKLDRKALNHVIELRSDRNRWAHPTKESQFSTDDAHRVADTTVRLLTLIDDQKAAEAAIEVKTKLMNRMLDNQVKKSVSKPVNGEDTPLTTKAGLPPWRMVVGPHEDVTSGSFTQAEFALDLSKAVDGSGDIEYENPDWFFHRTYLTAGLQDLMVTALRRLQGAGGDPVVQLQTNFGGGKTHSMLALYHLAKGKKLSEIDGADGMIERLGELKDHVLAECAVIVGTAFEATEPRRHDDCTTHTLWGEIAYQLGGVEAYAMVESADLAGVSPSSDTLRRLLDKFQPALIIIDELIAFVRNIYKAKEPLPAGSFDSVMTFVQALTEAVKQSANAMLLVSIPDSDAEIGGEGGKEALNSLTQTLGRIESVWKPVSPIESYEIVRRRLFSEVENTAARENVINSFLKMYKRNGSDFPKGVTESEYLNRMRQAYPIHPELFTRLYEDWSTLENFQRTRGVLRLMAEVIRALWNSPDRSSMIMPGSIPLSESRVRDEMLRYFQPGWPGIIDADIDGDDSKPAQQDAEVRRLGKYSASRKVARAIFVGSAPSATAQGVRGIEEVRIRLATVQPGERISDFNDALRRLENRLTYLNSDGTRYWYDTHPNLNRTAEEKARGLQHDDVFIEAERRLRKEKWDRKIFAAVHIAPDTTGDVPDEPHARVVVLGPEHTHTSNSDDSAAKSFLADIMKNRGNSPRHHRNMLIFIAPDADRYKEWDDSIRMYLAWDSIAEQHEELNLDAHQRKQARQGRNREEETLVGRLYETYCWLIVPQQSEDNQSDIFYHTERLPRQGTLSERAVSKIESNAWLYTKWAPDVLLNEVSSLMWRDQPHCSIKELWRWLTNYCYLPRLFNQNVLEATIKEGVSRDRAFAYATSVDDEGVYYGLKIDEPFTLYFNEHDLIVKYEVAQAQQNAERATQQAESTMSTEDSTRVIDVSVSTQPSAPPAPRPKTRYYASKQIDPQRAMRDLSSIADEIIVPLASLPGTNVEITIQISSHCATGFDDDTIRTVIENSGTLKLDDHGFEDY